MSDGEEWASNRALAPKCGVDEAVVRKWRSGEKIIPLGALLVLPRSIAKDMTDLVLEKHGMNTHLRRRRATARHRQDASLSHPHALGRRARRACAPFPRRNTMNVASSFVLAGARLLAPERDTIQVVEAIVDRVEIEQPLFADDADKRKTAAWLLAIAFRESSLTNDITSKTSDHCAFQIHLERGEKTSEGWTAADLRADAGKCVAVAFRMLRSSTQLCAAHPLAWYAEGPRGCESARAQRLSRDRLDLSKWLVARVATVKAP